MSGLLTHLGFHLQTEVPANDVFSGWNLPVRGNNRHTG